MKIAIIAVPYDSGRRSWRMGAGPEHLLQNGLAEELAAEVVTLATAGDEVGAAFDLAQKIRVATREALAKQHFPVILAGNCISTLGALAAFEEQPLLLWLDAHADLNTPATSPSGFLDGMALSVITGACHQDQHDFAPLPKANVIMLGVRDVDPGERAALAEVNVVRSSRQLWSTLASSKTKSLYFHLDLDALDPSVVRANHFAAPYGLSLHTLHDVIETVRQNQAIAGLTISAYDPAADAANQAPPLVLDIIKRVVDEPT